MCWLCAQAHAGGGGGEGGADADVVYTAAARPPLVIKATASWKLSCL